ncbi:LRRC29.2 family protein [Megaselia abdita]
MTTLTDLPPELSINILSHLTTSDLLKCRQATQLLYHVSGKTSTHGQLTYTFNGDYVNQSIESQLKTFANSSLTYKRLKFVQFNTWDFEILFEGNANILENIKSLSFEKCMFKKDMFKRFSDIDELKLVSCDIEEAEEDTVAVKFSNIRQVTIQDSHRKFYEGIYKSNITRLESLTFKDANFFKGFSEERGLFLRFLRDNSESLKHIWWNDFFQEIKRDEFFKCRLYNLRNCVYDKHYLMKLSNLESIEFSVYPELDFVRFPSENFSKTMKELCLFFVTVTKEFCDCISKFENLEILDLSHSDVTGIADLANGHAIKEFIGMNLKVSDTILIQFLWNMPNLLTLDLSGSNAVNNAVMQEISKSLPQLRKLNLSNTDRIDDAGLLGQFPIGRLLNLEDLNISSVRFISDAALEHFNFPNLKSLTLGYNTKISHEGIREATSKSPFLTSLVLLSLRKINDDIFPILRNLKYLKRLNLQFCSNISLKAAVDFQNTSTLKYFKIFQHDISSRKELDKLVYLICVQ